MSRFLSDSSIFSRFSLVSIPLVLLGIMILTTWISFRLSKVEPPKSKFMFAAAFLQILLGILTIYVVELIKYAPFLMIGTGLGITVLSNLLFINMFLKDSRKQPLCIWAFAAVLQMVFVPVCSGGMLLGWFVFYFMDHPPQP
jgi:hypothetical protein